jgi:hypothetical protein
LRICNQTLAHENGTLVFADPVALLVRELDAWHSIPIKKGITPAVLKKRACRKKR